MTAKTFPPKEDIRFRNTTFPILPLFLEAPTTAMLLGLKRRSSEWFDRAMSSPKEPSRVFPRECS